MTRLPRGEGRRLYDHQFQLRMPKSLFLRIKKSAVSHERPVNSEIVATLAAAYPEPEKPETVNDALLLASREILKDWSSTLEALGQSASENGKVSALADAIMAAEKKIADEGGAA